ncbi:hypothetical protein KQX54_013004 [Cotesia glomerata]|uniref:MULE transposase domain-containing protein n=1 Tax=Cotesia glomerata TaxID=32391 RepID=A0AAV7I0N8_COTGL|nr:hypothetical protein KQX54_013004 [Cotesia glomerata]
MAGNGKKKKEKRQVDRETKDKLKSLFAGNGEERVIDGFPFNISSYTYRDNLPIALLECKHRRRPGDGQIKCNAKSTFGLDGKFGPIKNEHNHRVTETLKAERAFHNKLRKASSASGDDLNKVFATVRRSHDDIPPVAFCNKRCTMRRSRSKVQPPHPKNLSHYAEILNSDLWNNYFQYKYGKIDTEQVGSGRDLSIVFYDSESIKKLLLLSEKGKVEFCVDATFNILPARIKTRQFLIVMMYIGNHAIPFMYALMTSKSTTAYKKIFDFLCTTFPSIKELDPTIHLDFELASRNALKDIIIPTSTIVPLFVPFYANMVRLPKSAKD